MPSQWIKYLSSPGQIRVVVIRADELVDEMVRLHALKGEGARGLGEATIAALMISSYIKPGERVNFQAQGAEGRIAQALVDAYPDGKVRGYVIEREDAAGAPAWGERGFLSVLRTKGDEGRQPYIGTVPFVSDELSMNLVHYWTQSEQVPTAAGIYVDIEGDRVRAAGGVLVQALGEATEEERRAVASCAKRLRDAVRELLVLEDPRERIEDLTGGRRFEELERDPLRFECRCSLERVERALVLAGSSELEAALERDGRAEVRCDFCTRNYVVEATRLRELIETARARG